MFSKTMELHMATATLTSKGQVVIPKPIRDQLGLHAGDRLDFALLDSGDVLVRPAVCHVDELFGILAKPGRTPVSVEAMKQAVRRRAARECQA